MRKTLLTIATVGLLGLSTMTGAFAQQLTPAQARAAAITSCATGSQTACELALAALVEAVRVVNPGATTVAVNAIILREFQSVSGAVRRSVGNVANVAIVDQVFDVVVPGSTEAPSSSPA